MLNYDVRFKFNPPFRDEKNRIELIDAFKEGLFDHFTSLHVPATGDIYAKSFYDQPFGAETISNYLNLVSHLFIEQEI